MEAHGGWSALLFFAVAVIVLDFFDISLPRGDSIGVSGALAAAGLLILGPVPALAICVLSSAASHMVRCGLAELRRCAAAVGARLAGLGLGVAAALALGGILPSGLVSYAVVTAVPAVFLLAEAAVAEAAVVVGSGRPLGRSIGGSLRMQAPLLSAQWSASVLLVITFGQMGAWSLFPVIALLLLIRQSYAMLLDIRETYRTTIEVLVEAAEGTDLRKVGHAERTALRARAIAMRMGLSAAQVERISYAALLHDVNAIREAPQSPDEGGISDGNKSSTVLEGVSFLSDVLPILRLCDGEHVGGDDPGERDAVAALIVALASDVDSAERPTVAASHSGEDTARLAPSVSAVAKSRVVAAAVALGYRTPAVP